MKSGLVEIKLGNGALRYALEILEEGGPISRAAVGQLPRLSRLYTWANAGTDGSWLDEHVRDAGVLVPPSAAARGMIVPIDNPGRDLFLDLVCSRLHEQNSRVVIDDPWSMPSDLDLGEPGRVLYAETNVAHVLGSGATRESIDEMLRNVLTRDWFGMLGRLPAESAGLQYLTQSALDSLSASATLWLFPAFDNEGWIIGDLG
jgi:hypothetical protein